MKDYYFKGILTGLKIVDEDDASDICNLRNNPKYNQFLSSSKTITIGCQKEWIRCNRIKKDNVYFKIIELQTNRTVGTISLYNCLDKEAEFGRYICEQTIQAIEAEYLILKFGFDILKLNRIFCKTIENNNHVWKQHYKFGFRDVGVGIEKINNIVFRVQEIRKIDFENFNYDHVISLLKRFEKSITK